MMVDLYSGADIGGGDAVIVLTAKNGRPVRARPVFMIDETGGAIEPSKRESLSLVDNSVAAAARKAFGGDYAVRAFASQWNGASAKIQFVDADKVTWSDLTNQDGSAVAPFSANRTQPVGLAGNATIRVVVTGSPTGLVVVADRIPS